MAMYYPMYHQQGEINGIDIYVLRQSLLLCVGLFSLLHMQHLHEGHMDEHVFDLFSSKMHLMEQQLSNSLEVHALESVPF